MDFELYKGSKEFYSTYHLANDKNHRIYSDKLTLHVLELNKEEYATKDDKDYGIDYWARLFKSTTWEELKMLAQEKSSLQSTVETIYRVNADEYARAEIIARERQILDQLTQQDEMQKKDAVLAAQTNTITEQANTIIAQEQKLSEQNAEINRLRAEIAALKNKAN